MTGKGSNLYSSAVTFVIDDYIALHHALSGRVRRLGVGGPTEQGPIDGKVALLSSNLTW